MRSWARGARDRVRGLRRRLRVAPANIRSISCVAGCAAADAAKSGSLLRVRGRGMGDVAKIVFLGGGGHADHATVRVSEARRNKRRRPGPGQGHERTAARRQRRRGAVGGQPRDRLRAARRGRPRRGRGAAARPLRVSRLRRRHGSGHAAFGAQRSGHIHQGHDVFARCGTPMVAARGGVVKLNKFEGFAGNYIVIDGEGADTDDVYVHLREPSPVAKGARVLTGQRSAASARPATPAAATCTSSCGPGPAGTPAAPPSIRSRF